MNSKVNGDTQGKSQIYSKYIVESKTPVMANTRHLHNYKKYDKDNEYRDSHIESDKKYHQSHCQESISKDHPNLLSKHSVNFKIKKILRVAVCLCKTVHLFDSLQILEKSDTLLTWINKFYSLYLNVKSSQSLFFLVEWNINLVICAIEIFLRSKQDAVSK